MKTTSTSKIKTTKSRPKLVDASPSLDSSVVDGYCSPERIKNYQKNKTCFTHTELVQLARDWNAHQTEQKIPSPEKMTVSELRKALDARYTKKTGCSKEVCWAKASPTLQPNTRDIFRPLRSDTWRSGHQWLSTTDIMHVMKQYENVHDDYVFLGVFPIDFEMKVEGSCVVRSMCNFNVRGLLKEKKRMFSMVINLDTHDQPGSHWVTLFCCVDPKDPKYGICYFDSGGLPPEPIQGTSKDPITAFMRRIKNEVVELYGKEHENMFWVRYNPEQKQFKNTECGMFCILFNILCLEHTDADYKRIRQMIGNDEDVHELRKIFYVAVDDKTTVKQQKIKKHNKK